jgi:hypothetical protein
MDRLHFLNFSLSVTRTLEEFSHDIFTNSKMKNGSEHYLNGDHKKREDELARTHPVHHLDLQSAALASTDVCNSLPATQRDNGGSIAPLALPGPKTE